MWIGGTLYYESDADGVLQPLLDDPGAVKQAADRFTDFDAGRPRRDRQDRLRPGGAARDPRPATGQVRAVSFQVSRTRGAPLPEERQDWITAIGPLADGHRAVVPRRGEVFTGRARRGDPQLSRDAGSRDKDATWAPRRQANRPSSPIAPASTRFRDRPLGEESPVRLTTTKRVPLRAALVARLEEAGLHRPER